MTDVARSRAVIAIDTGGTFTDVVGRVAGELRVVKIPSTPADPAHAVLAGIARLLEDAAAPGGPVAPELLIHGSTVATNALLERKGARVALVTNHGFEDVLELGRQNRPQLYALAGARPLPLVPQECRLGVRGRLDPGGEELEPTDGEELAGLAERVRAAGADTVAVALLHSYADDRHEREIAARLRAAGMAVTVSSELLSEYREYERFSTAVVNAYVAPLMDGYLSRLEAGSPGQRLRLMGSAGGVLAPARARLAPVHTILSGPAGGVAGARHVAVRHRIDRIMTFDMGGTSTDVSLCAGEIPRTREFMIGGLPVAVPVLDIHTVGAGGGSIVRLDAGGALRVGPESAGAVPGPVCYGRGGTELTVTDANVALGRLPSTADSLDLDAGAIAAPLAALAGRMGITPVEAAAGIVAVVNTSMEGALRVISMERGHDPRDFTLVPFGGAAGLHAVALAERLEIPRLLVPPAPGVLSAFGMLVAEVRYDAARSVLLADGGDAAASDALDRHFAALEEEALSALRDEEVEDGTVLHRRVEARYIGQSHELTVAADDWQQRFHAAHEQRFGYCTPARAVEAVTLRVEAVGPAPHVEAPVVPAASGPPRPRGVVDTHQGAEPVRAPLYSRAELRAGHRITGPALLSEPTATFWLPPDWAAHVLEDGSLLVQR